MFDDTMREAVVEQLPEQAVPEQPVEQPTQPTPEETSRELNFKALREAKERERKRAEQLEQERDAAIRRAQELEQLKRVSPAPEQDDLGINPDDLVEGKHLLQQHRLLKQLKDEIESQKRVAQEAAQQAELAKIESRLKSQFSDFDTIVSKENLEILAARDPDAVAIINKDGNVYNKALSAYTLIKQYGIGELSASVAEHAQLSRNAAKPRAAASTAPQSGQSPLSMANEYAQGLTKEMKEQIYKASMEATRNY